MHRKFPSYSQKNMGSFAAVVANDPDKYVGEMNKTQPFLFPQDKYPAVNPRTQQGFGFKNSL